jgi:hypothetical protein
MIFSGLKVVWYLTKLVLLLIVANLVIVFIIVCLLNILSKSIKQDFLFKSRVNIPSIRNGCIFINDATSPTLRKVANLLASRGIHVLAGVPTESHKKSFLYEIKGVEPIIYSSNNLSTLSDVLLRIKQITYELDRQLSAVVIKSEGMTYDVILRNIKPFD